jgi:mycothiol synthase
MLTLRPFADDDYPALAELYRLVWGEARSVGGLRAADADWPAGALRVRYVAEQDGAPVLIGGYSATPWAAAPDKYFLSCMVHPAHQGRGLGGAWFRQALGELRGRGARLLTATVRDDHPLAPGFLERRGFRVTLREPESRLELRAFDPRRFAGRDEVPGVAILSAPELQRRDPEWGRRCWDLAWELLQDVPTNEELTREPLEEFVAAFEDEAFHPAGYFVAIDSASGALVGTCHTGPRDGEPAHWEFGLTGVRRSHRRRGIATALKLRAIAHAAANGAALLISDNEERNPMYALNQQLGFRYAWTWLGCECQLDGASALYAMLDPTLRRSPPADPSE